MSFAQISNIKVDRPYIFLLLVIFSLAIFLRFDAVAVRGIYSYDEGAYFSEMKFVSEGFSYILSHGVNKRIDFEQLKHATSGLPLFMAKPGFVFILFIFAYEI